MVISIEFNPPYLNEQILSHEDPCLYPVYWVLILIIIVHFRRLTITFKNTYRVAIF